METDQISVTRQAGNSTLSFRAVSTNDAGSYECFANNTYGTDSLSVTLSVLLAPVITLTPDDVIVHAGESPTEPLQCEAMGNPQPIVTILDPMGSIVSINGVWNPTILYRQNGGTYTCVATNSVNQATNTFMITVQGIFTFQLAILSFEILFLSLNFFNLSLHLQMFH